MTKVLLQLYRSKHHDVQLSGVDNLVYISLFTALYVLRYVSSLSFEMIFDIPFKILENKIVIKIRFFFCTSDGVKISRSFFNYTSKLINQYYIGEDSLNFRSYRILYQVSSIELYKYRQIRSTFKNIEEIGVRKCFLLKNIL